MQMRLIEEPYLPKRLTFGTYMRSTVASDSKYLPERLTLGIGHRSDTSAGRALCNNAGIGLLIRESVIRSSRTICSGSRIW
jgi:hypothetical protein